MSKKDPIAVEASFDRKGSPRPRAFTWRGKRRLVTSWGRSRKQEGLLHMLVMERLGEVYELAYDLDDGTWLLLRAPDDFGRRRGPI